MLDETFVAVKKEAGDYSPIPPDVYTVELLDVVAKTEESYDSKEARKKDASLEAVNETVLDFHFVLLEGIDDGKDLRGRSLFQNFVPSFLYISTKKGKNKLYQVVEALQGHAVTQEQEAFGITGIELNKLIGKQCRVGTINKVSGDKTYSNIDKFLPVKDKYNSLTAEEKDKARVKPKTEEHTNDDGAPDITESDIQG